MKKWGLLLLLLVILETLSVAFYLGSAATSGFPLDDAWIHQAYARNLGLHGEMAFTAGQPSTGSTSFGWTILLAAGYWLKIPFLAWTYFLGAFFAVATAYLAALLSHGYFGNFRNAVIVAVMGVFEWHLAWAAVSGMEIGLVTFLTLLFLLLVHRDFPPLLLGGLAGIIILVRPEGVLFAAVYGLKLLLDRPRRPRLVRDGFAFLSALVLIITPWILFNLTYSQRPFPNTIAAKFMVYGYPWSLWKTLKYPWDVLIYLLNGPLLILVPCTGLVLRDSFGTRSRTILPVAIWSLLLVGLYALALPAIYDHGRYLMPLIPLVAIIGVEGLARLLRRFPHSPGLHMVVWASLTGMVLAAWVSGASDFSFRVRLFDLVHMQAAAWINANTPPDAIIATHDIGILGYQTGREVVDLAGLITPEIVPLMNDPEGMAAYVQAGGVTHLVVYTGYYRELLRLLDARLVFSPGAAELRSMGVEPFEVYELGR